MKKTLTTVIVATAASALIAHADLDLEKRVAVMENELAQLKAAIAPVMEKVQAEQAVALQRNEAKKRMRKNSELYSRNELKEIEALYQVANKQWRTPEGKNSLKELISKYDQANRTGCALLYLGQMSKGEERENYLTQAITDFSDCFYGDGVQVGAYARYYLAYHYKESGEEKKSSALFEELREIYPNAISHKGKLLSTLIEN